MKAGLAVLAAAVAAAAIGCGANLEKMKASPAKYDGKQVKLEGFVKDIRSIPATKKTPGATVYTVQAGSGPVWVLRGKDSTVKTVPRANFLIKVTGIFRAEQMVDGMKYAPLIVELDAKQEIQPAAPGALRAE